MEVHQLAEARRTPAPAYPSTMQPAPPACRDVTTRIVGGAVGPSKVHEMWVPTNPDARTIAPPDHERDDGEQRHQLHPQCGRQHDRPGFGQPQLRPGQPPDRHHRWQHGGDVHLHSLPRRRRGDGKRASKTVSSTTTTYIYDVNRGLPVLLEDGTRRYVWGLALAYEVEGSAALVFHVDGLGSVRALTDSTKAVVQTYETPPPPAWAQPIAPLGATGLLSLLAHFWQRGVRPHTRPSSQEGWNPTPLSDKMSPSYSLRQSGVTSTP